jgi:hypothetical protein
MIRLLPLGEYSITDHETPASLIERLMLCAQLNISATIQETQVGRVLPPDEKLIDGREYYISFGYVN